MPNRRGAAAAIVFVAGCLGWVLGAPGASADPVDDSAAALRTAKVYIDPTAQDRGVKLSARPVPRDVKIAVLPDTGIPGVRLAAQIAASLGAVSQQPVTVGVFTVDEDGRASFRAVSSRYCDGFADGQAQAARGVHATDLAAQLDLTSTVSDFVRRLANGPVDEGDARCAGESLSGAAVTGGAVWPWVIAIAVVGASGITALAFYSRRSQERRLESDRAQVRQYQDRLAGEIQALDPRGNAPATQALADASDRLAAARSLLTGGHDETDTFDLARRALLEGLHATRAARAALGVDTGAPLPPVEESEHEQLTSPQQVTVLGQTHLGYPAYTPGAPHYFAGGSGVPGGWYETAFWHTLLLDSVLSDGFAGFAAAPGADDAGRWT